MLSKSFLYLFECLNCIVIISVIGSPLFDQDTHYDILQVTEAPEQSEALPYTFYSRWLGKKDTQNTVYLFNPEEELRLARLLLFDNDGILKSYANIIISPLETLQIDLAEFNGFKEGENGLLKLLSSTEQSYSKVEYRYR